MNEPKKENFLSLIKIDEEANVGGISLKSIVEGAYTFSEKVWKNPELDKFTDHTLYHSYKVLKRALDIATKLIPGEDYKLSNRERMILCIATLIHDIGMQYNKYLMKGEPKKPDNEIRNRHCSLGDKMVQDALSNRRKRRRLPQFPIENKFAKKYIGDARCVAFSHHPSPDDKIANKYWEKLNSEGYNADGWEGGERLRPKLLAGLLRLSDTLDMDMERVPDFGKLSSSNLSPENKAHWFCCYYTRSIEITPGAGDEGVGSIYIRLHWRAPDKDEEIKFVRVLLQKIRVEKFNLEKGSIGPYLIRKEREKEPIIDNMEMDDSDLQRSKSFEPLPEEVKEYIKNEFANYDLGEKKLEVKNLIELSGNDFEVAKQKADEHIRGGKGAINAHYVLNTKWHTNEYIKCRELVEDNVFSEGLVMGLAKMFKDSKLTRIIAQGTSAIRIGSLLSIVLGIKFSYVSGNAKFQFEKPTGKKYSEFEGIATVSEGDKIHKILIMDDILGVGEVFRYLLSNLQKLKFRNENLLFFYIYSLGHEKKKLEEIPGVKVYYLKAFPDIKYWKEYKKGECVFCKGKKEIRNYEDGSMNKSESINKS